MEEITETQQNEGDNTSNSTFYDNIFQALKENKLYEIRNSLRDTHPSDIAELINLCEGEDRVKIISLIDGIDHEVLPFLDSEAKQELITLIGSQNSADAISKLENDDAIQFIEDLPEQSLDAILHNLEDEKREFFEEVLQFPEDSAGRLMNKNYVTVRREVNVGDVIDLLREKEDLPQDFYTIFIIDANNKPTDYVPLSRIIRNKREIEIADIMQPVSHHIRFDLDQEEAANIFQKYGLISAPIVDANDSMIGVITMDDIADVIVEEYDDDLMKLSGFQNHENALESSISKFLNRCPWLFVNLISSIVASLVISVFETDIEKLVALAVLMPIIASMSGNVGSQTLTVAVRALATNELINSNIAKVFRKEVYANILSSSSMGLILAIVSYLLYHNISLTFLIFLSIVITFLFASVIGLFAPYIMNKINIDPAISSSAIVYAVTDISSFFVFLGMARIFL